MRFNVSILETLTLSEPTELPWQDLDAALYRLAIKLSKNQFSGEAGSESNLSPNFQNHALHDPNHGKLKIVVLTCDPHPAIVHQYKYKPNGKPNRRQII